MRRMVVIVMASALAGALFAAAGEASPNPCDGLCVGAASVDTSWHTGAGQGQYGTNAVEADPFDLEAEIHLDKFDPFHHQTKMVPSGGHQSRLFTKAIVVKGADGGKVAYVKTELYLQQDLLTRRVAELVEGDPAVPDFKDFKVDGLDGKRIMLGATHNHSAPQYASTAFGVILFTDSFDFRMFETTARKIARAIKAANDNMVPAQIGASVSPFREVQHNILGPGTADDGTPAGFPRDYFDDELAVVRFDAADGSGPIAALVNFGMHPESLSTMDLISADFVGMVERMVERGMGRKPGAAEGPVVAWSQGSVGDVEPERSRANPPSAGRNYWHRDVTQMERMSRLLAAAVLDTWRDVAEKTPGISEKFVEFSTEVPVGMVDYRFSGPATHPYPSYGNCRTETARLPGLPTCFSAFEELDLEEPEQLGTTIDTLKSLGVPIPDSAISPNAYGGVQESLQIHLQAIRLGDILLGSCPCEPVSDMVRNFKSRTDAARHNMHLGFEWPCKSVDDEIQCDSRSAQWQQEDWRRVDPDAQARMLAQIQNDASGWEEDFATLQGQSEPLDDPEEIKGNFTHEEIQELSCGEATCAGYRLPLMVGQANDYIGYIVTYREHMRGDHYRKALTAYGPHTADYVNTRLVRMGAELKRGEGPDDATLDPVVGPTDFLVQTAKLLTAGKGATVGLAAYEAAIPDDGGDAGEVISPPPKQLPRFGAATLTWVGGSNWTDNPVVTVERHGPDGSWETVATQEGGEIVVTLEYESPSPEAALDWLQGGKTYQWTATFEVFEETEPGIYRFAVDGHHRRERKANPYHIESDSFAVLAWEGIAAHDLTVDASPASASFLIDGVEILPGIGPLETDEDAVLSPDEIHYPDRYLADTPRTPYINETYTPIGEHTYCFRCTFRPWANTGHISSAQVTVIQSDGFKVTYPASFDTATSRWVAEGLDLANGDKVVVERAGVVDEFDNINGKESNQVGPLTGLADRLIETALTYTGDAGGTIGSEAQVSAVLRTAAGAPLEGHTLTFTRGGHKASAVTGPDGEAATTNKVGGPPGSKRNLAVSFAGSGNLQPSEIEVPFEAVPPGASTPAGLVGAWSIPALALLLLLFFGFRMFLSHRDTVEVTS